MVGFYPSELSHSILTRRVIEAHVEATSDPSFKPEVSVQGLEIKLIPTAMNTKEWLRVSALAILPKGGTLQPVGRLKGVKEIATRDGDRADRIENTGFIVVMTTFILYVLATMVIKIAESQRVPKSITEVAGLIALMVMCAIITAPIIIEAFYNPLKQRKRKPR